MHLQGVGSSHAELAPECRVSGLYLQAWQGCLASVIYQQAPLLYLHRRCAARREALEVLYITLHLLPLISCVYFCVAVQAVLPDGKRSEDDIVVFLQPQHAAPDADEAEQRAALAALHRRVPCSATGRLGLGLTAGTHRQTFTDMR